MHRKLALTRYIFLPEPEVPSNPPNILQAQPVEVAASVHDTVRKFDHSDTHFHTYIHIVEQDFTF